VQFSAARCLELLRGGARRSLPALLDDVHEKVVEHTGSAALTDDCTMLALRRLAAER
jgi:serine phosphatase RsbU (regulator of sigma subunit)